MPDRRKSPRAGDVAVIGMAGRFPGAPDLAAFWENLRSGRDSISWFTEEELKAAGVSDEWLELANYVRAKGIVPGHDEFDASFFNYPPRDAARMDPQIRLLHESCWHALEDAGYTPESAAGSIGAYLGVNDNLDWIERIISSGASYGDNFDHFLLNYRDYASTRVSFRLNLTGPSFTLLSACSTSLLAVHLACQALRAGDCKIALAGGSSIMFPEVSGYLYQEGLMLSSDGKCRPFDASADGTVFGDGVGVVVLKLLSEAKRDHDNILAVIRGSAINNDGNDKPGFTTPSAAGQRDVIRAAHKAAGVVPSQISFVETHGTGTRAGDPVEFLGLVDAFGKQEHGYCALGCLKANIGHVNVAAGVAALIKTILALRHREIPPHPYFQSPNPAIDLDSSPFSINTSPLPWRRRKGKRIAGVSAFGFGGTNAHLILEEAARTRTRVDNKPYHLLPVSAKSPASLAANASALADWLESHPASGMTDTAFTLTAGRKEFPFRLSVAAPDTAAAAAELRRTRPEPKPASEMSIAFMYPGQGSQFPGMGADLYREEPVFRKAVDRCAARLRELNGPDVLRYVGPGGLDRTKEELSETRIAQPVIFVYSYALTQLLTHWGIKPSAVIGHSMGEIVAACVAGVLSLDDALYLIARRGELLDTMERGSMLAVQIEEEQLAGYIGPAGGRSNEELSIAAVNAPSVVVVSGRTPRVKELQAMLRADGIASQVLATSHAFHSHLMEPVLSEFSRIGVHLRYNAPAIRMMSTVTASWVGEPGGAVIDTTYWSQNIRKTVRFSDAIRRLILEHPGMLLEVGPGTNLLNLVKLQRSVLNGHPLVATVDTARRQIAGGCSTPELGSLYSAVGRMWEAGAPLDWSRFRRSRGGRRISLPGYTFEKQKFPRPESRKQVDPAPGGSWSQLNKIADSAAWYYVPSWKRTPPPYFKRDESTPAQCWIIMKDCHGVGDSIIEELKNASQDVIQVVRGADATHGPVRLADSVYEIDPGRYNDLIWLFTQIQESGKTPSRIVHCWTITGTDRTDVRDEPQFPERGFFSLLHLAQVIGAHAFGREANITVVTNGLHDVLGDEPVIPEKAAILGPVKVIQQEYPDIRCCSIDIGAVGENGCCSAETILSESVTNALDPVVAYRNGHRWVQSFERVRLEPSLETRNWITPGGVYLITGGTGGLGIAFAEFLSRTAGVRVVLTSRTGFPPAEEWPAIAASDDPRAPRIRTLLELKGRGCVIDVHAADVVDETGMDRVFARIIGQYGRLDGVIHAAGIPGDGIIQLKKDEQAREILMPKIDGTAILERCIARHCGANPPQWVLLCSSVASFLGGIGLVDYCSANAYLDAFVVNANRSGSTRWLAVNWDMWGESGMGLKTAMPDELQQWLRKELRDGLTNAEGVTALDRVMSWNRSANVIVSTRDLQARIDLWVRREFIKSKESLLDESDDAAAKYTRPSAGPAFQPPENEIEQAIAAAWKKLFSVEPIGRNDNYFELGGHSLLATTLVSRLKREFNTGLSIRDILDHPVLSDLAEFIAAKRESSQSPHA